MQVINAQALVRFWKKHPDARGWLERWLAVAQRAEWQDICEVGTSYASADGVRVESGNIVTIFNVRGNKYRLVASISYERQVIYVWEVLTHKEYDKDLWKKRL
jgi:mRNA interferase HigB